MNQLELSARVLECAPLRYTPAGAPVLEMVLEHAAQVMQAGHARQVAFTISALALGDLALLLANTALGTALHVVGFLAPLRKGSAKLTLHLQQVRKISGSAGRDPQVV